MSETRWFSHSGDLGDIIYALPAIRACGGGSLFLTHTEGKTSHGMTEAKVERLRPLLERQPYIDSVEWDINCELHNLDGFRDHWQEGVIADKHLSAVGKCWSERCTAWLEVDEKHTRFDVIVARSFRYRNDFFAWGRVVEKYAGRIGFVGFRDEHEDFCRRFGDIPFVPAGDFLELAEVIAGSQWFIGNQSAPLAVAHGMFHPTVTEVSIGQAQNDCWFQRDRHIFGWDGKVVWPELA